jgi:hypothetical protein
MPEDGLDVDGGTFAEVSPPPPLAADTRDKERTSAGAMFMETDADDHDAEHFAASYREVIAAIERVRTGHNFTDIATNTRCMPCLLEGLAHIAAGLGDREAAIRVARARLLEIAEEAEIRHVDLGLE